MGSEKRFLSLKKSEKILPPNASQELERLSLDAKVFLPLDGGRVGDNRFP